MAIYLYCLLFKPAYDHVFIVVKAAGEDVNQVCNVMFGIQGTNVWYL